MITVDVTRYSIKYVIIIIYIILELLKLVNPESECGI